MKNISMFLICCIVGIIGKAQNCPEIQELKANLNMKDRPFETIDKIGGIEFRFLKCYANTSDKTTRFDFIITNIDNKEVFGAIGELTVIDMEGNVYFSDYLQGIKHDYYGRDTRALYKGQSMKVNAKIEGVAPNIRYFRLVAFKFAHLHNYTMQYKDVRISYPDEQKKVVPATSTQSNLEDNYMSLIKKASSYYNESKFDQALAGFEEAYKVKKDTLACLYAGASANFLKNTEKTKVYLKDFIALGGKATFAYEVLKSLGENPETIKPKNITSINFTGYPSQNWLGLWSGQIDSPMLLSLYLNVEQISDNKFTGYYYHQPLTIPGDKGRHASGTINGNKIRFLIEQNWFEGTLSGNKIEGRGDLRSKNDAVFWLKKGGNTETANFYEYRGRIIDKKTKTVPNGVMVYYEDISTGETLGQTDVNANTGEYVINLPYGKRYGITAKAQGFVASSISIDLVKSNAKPVLKNADLYVIPIESGASINLNNIFFNAGKSNLLPESFAELNRIADFLTENKNVVVEIGGHTDNVGNDQTNLTLSQDRADAVRFYLLSKGIKIVRLQAKGYGKNLPVATNTTEDGKAQNRRVEFMIMKK